MSLENNPLFAKAKSLNPDLTEAEFVQKREEALSRANANPHAMTDVGGVMMEDSAENRAEIHESADSRNAHFE